MQWGLQALGVAAVILGGIAWIRRARRR
jgi:hypothetical protein